MTNVEEVQSPRLRPAQHEDAINGSGATGTVGGPVGHDESGSPALHPTAELGLNYNPFDPSFRADPHAFFSRARAEAPVCFNPIFNMWLVTGYEEVMKVCTDNVTFSSQNKVDPPNEVLPEVLDILNNEGYPVALQLFNTDPPDHARLRALVGQAFTNDVMLAAEPRIRATVGDWIDGWADQEVVDLYAAYIEPMPLTVILDFIGVPREHHARVRTWDDAWARLFTSADAIADQLDAVRAVVAYQHFLDDLIEQRRDSPADDLISRCVHAHRGDYAPLTNPELVWQIMGLLAAGHATTTDALTQLLLLLLQQPRRWSTMLMDGSSFDDVVEEGLRYVNPVLGLPRITTREVEIGGVALPAGAEVLVSFCSANRDDKFVGDAGKFDPSRENVSRHLGFGWGVHRCIGGRISKVMMVSALEQLAARFPDMRLVDDFRPSHTEHPFLWGVAGLPVKLFG